MYKQALTGICAFHKMVCAVWFVINTGWISDWILFSDPKWFSSLNLNSEYVGVN